MNGKYWMYLFFADLLAELTAIALDVQTIRYFTKPLLVILLFAWFMQASPKLLALRYCIAAALFFSWLGDICLLNEGTAWFMAGLGSFLLAHIMYILFFLQLRQRQTAPKSWNFYVIALVAIYAISLFSLLYNHIGSLKIPVGIYACTIATMLIAAIHAFKRRGSYAAGCCIGGAVLFMISDSMLAINKFYHPFAAANISIMLTYGLAQFAIIKGSLLYLAAGNPRGLATNVNWSD